LVITRQDVITSDRRLRADVILYRMLVVTGDFVVVTVLELSELYVWKYVWRWPSC